MFLSGVCQEQDRAGHLASGTEAVAETPWPGKKTPGVSFIQDTSPPLSPIKRRGRASRVSVSGVASRLTSGGEPLLLLTVALFPPQVSVLTDQVEAQGEKIRDLEVCLEGHQVKLNAAEEMLQQVRAVGLEASGFSRTPCVEAPFLCQGHSAYSPPFPGLRLAARCVALIQQVKPARTLRVAELEGEGGAGLARVKNLLGWLDRFPGSTFSGW